MDQIFDLKQLCEKAREKNQSMNVGCIDLEKAYHVVREALGQVMKILKRYQEYVC